MRAGSFVPLMLAGAMFVGGCASTNKAMQAGGDPDEIFMTRAAQMNLAEIVTGRLAAEKSEDSDVRQFGTRMVQEHMQANDKLLRIAESMDVTLPEEPDEMHRQLADRLATLEGQEFEREYIRAMLKDHQEAVSMFEEMGPTIQEPALRSWADEMLPILNQHLDMARLLDRKLSGPTG